MITVLMQGRNFRQPTAGESPSMEITVRVRGRPCNVTHRTHEQITCDMEFSDAPQSQDVHLVDIQLGQADAAEPKTRAAWDLETETAAPLVDLALCPHPIDENLGLGPCSTGGSSLLITGRGFGSDASQITVIIEVRLSW